MSGTNDIEAWLNRLDSPTEIPQLSIVIPAYNERWRLPSTLVECFDYFDSRKLRFEVIVVDDGSSDDTAAIVSKFERLRPELRLIRLACNRGKGHAVKSGVLNARGTEVLIADADGSSPFMEVERLEKALASGADVAIGSRALHSKHTEIQSRWYRTLLGRIFNKVVNVVVLPGIADTQCGFKLFRRDAAQFLFQRQESEQFSFDIEILFIARRAGLAIAEVPINWHHAPGSKVNLILDSAKMLIDVFKFRVRHRAAAPNDYSEFITMKSEESSAQPQAPTIQD